MQSFEPLEMMNEGTVIKIGRSIPKCNTLLRFFPLYFWLESNVRWSWRVTSVLEENRMECSADRNPFRGCEDKKTHFTRKWVLYIQYKPKEGAAYNSPLMRFSSDVLSMYPICRLVIFPFLSTIKVVGIPSIPP